MAIKIMLDAGHYGKYNRSPFNNKYYESEMTWKLHLLLKEALERYGFDVKTTRTAMNEDSALYQRGLCAKGNDLFLSLHSNACDNPSVDRVEVYKAFDNRNNADVLAKRLAECIAKVMNVSYGKVKTRESKDYPGTEYYGVLRGASKADVPLYYIIEHSFHTNQKATEFLMSEENLKKLAEAEAYTIAEYYEVETVTFVDGDVNGDGKINAKDYMMLKKGILGTRKLTEDEQKRADVNGDGEVDAIDYLKLKRNILKK